MKKGNKPRQRGTGRIWMPERCTTYWVSYSYNGRKIQRNSNCTNYTAAEQFLKTQMAETTLGKRNPMLDNITVAEIVASLLLQYKNDANKSLEDDERRWTLRLKPFFGTWKASQVTTESLRRYIAERQTQVFKKSPTSVGKTPSNATINRELALLRCAFHQARKDSKLVTVPHFPMLDESNNVRKGFLTDAQMQSLVNECAAEGLWLRTLLEVGLQYGWRVSEPLSLAVGQIDFRAREIRLDDSKNGEGRTVPIVDETLFQLLTACCENKKTTDAVFTRSGGHGIGKGERRVRTFYKLWSAVCERAGVPGLLFHDLRRTAVRNMRRLGIPESVAMKITGHKTRDVFERYNIVNTADVKDALKLVTAHRQVIAQEAGKPTSDKHEINKHQNQGKSAAATAVQ